MAMLATVVSVASYFLLLLGKRQARWEAIPCIVGLVLLLALLIDLLSSRWWSRRGPKASVPGDVVRAGQERFRSTGGQKGPPEGDDRVTRPGARPQVG
jgi:hypothetical protein